MSLRACAAAGLAVVLSIWRIATPRGLGAAQRNLFIIGLAIAAALTLYSGHLGGQMVYDHGVGVTIGKRSFGSKGLPAESLPGHQPREEEPEGDQRAQQGERKE